MQQVPFVCIIILFWNGHKWIDNCIGSVINSNYSNFKVIAVDNGSSDTTANDIANRYPEVYLIRNKKNFGFAEGNNVGIRYSLKQSADYVALLNQDTIVDSNWILELINVAEENNNIGILSPMQYDYQGNNIDTNFLKILKNNAQFKADYKNDTLQRTYEISETIGAAMLIKRKIFQKIGLFDSIYFCYGEDTDLCRRVKFHGFKIVVVTISKIKHWHSLIDSEGLSETSKCFFLKAQIIYLLKDPKKNLFSNLYIYIRYNMLSIMRWYGSLKDFRYLLKMLSIQIWALSHLPVIVYRHYKDKQLN